MKIANTDSSPDKEGAIKFETPELVFLFLSAAILTLVWYFPYPPLQDMPEWMYQSHIIRLLFQGAPHGDFALKPYPVPYTLIQVIAALLGRFMDSATAAKLIVSGYVVIAIGICSVFLKRYACDRAIFFSVMAVSVIYSASFWNGYMGYQFGILLIAAFLSLPRALQNNGWVIALFGILAFLFHGFCFLIFCVLSALIALFSRRFRTFAVAILPSLTLWTWYIAARLNEDVSQEPVKLAPLRFLAYKVYTLTKAGPYHNFMLEGPSPVFQPPVFHWIGIIANVLFVGLLFPLGWQVARSKPRWTAERTAFVFLLLVMLVLPPTLGDVVNPGERVLYPLIVLMLACVDWRSYRPARMFRTSFLFLFVPLFASMTFFVGHIADAIVGMEPSSSHAAEVVQEADVRTLFWHRPFRFSNKFLAIELSEKLGQPPSLPLEFRTSVLDDKRPPTH